VTAQIQALAASDIPAVLPLIEQYWIFEDVSGFDAARVARELTRVCADPALASGWIARARGEPVGYLLAVYVYSLEHLGLTAEIDEFFVLPRARGRGLGEELLRRAEAEFVRRGCTNVALQLGKGNERASAFYESHGYRRRARFELLKKDLPGG